VLFTTGAISDGIAYAIYNLLIHSINLPEIQDKIRKEADSALVRGDSIVGEDLEKLDYTFLCVKEAFRLGAPFTFLPELMSKEDIEIGEYQLKKESLIYVDIPYIHRNPEQWQKPNEFVPERFIGNHPMAKTPSGHTRHVLSYVPFYAGERRCPAENMTYNNTLMMCALFI
jgi:cytochrome P450